MVVVLLSGCLLLLEIGFDGCFLAAVMFWSVVMAVVAFLIERLFLRGDGGGGRLRWRLFI